ncbi:MAG TPA: hypothetical protein VE089_05900 [Nitrososphaeraceae archaeon]|jgi:hypothetical protein|nr:hypothetical protein [Nitrososphaeraceae archaeon]
MTKFTSQEQAEIKNIVKECNVRRLTDNKTLEQIKMKTGKDITFRQLSNIKSKIKGEAAERIENRVSTLPKYLAPYKELIDNLDYYKKSLFRMYDSSKDKPKLQLSCLKEMHSIDKTLEKIYNRIIKMLSTTTTN